MCKENEKKSKENKKKCCPFTCAKISIFCGQYVNFLASLLCLIGSFAIIFDTRDRAIKADGSLDVIAAGITMILKLLSIFYMLNVDSEFIMVKEKLVCKGYIHQRRTEIEKEPRNCVKWEKNKCTKSCDVILLICKILLNLGAVAYAAAVVYCW